MSSAVKPLDAQGVNGRRVDLLQHDPELSRLVAGRRASAALPAVALRLDHGPWRPATHRSRRNQLGFLILDGLLGRRVAVPGRGRSLELLGKGDLFCPWQEDSPSFSEITWSVFEPGAIAALDEEFMIRARRMPQLLELLAERALRRSRRLAVSAAITNAVGVEERVVLLLWQLAERWGQRIEQGVLVPIRLSHEALADLVGARRPTVTLALRSLYERGAVKRRESGEWILTADPP